jgi:hypothetical protein
MAPTWLTVVAWTALAVAATSAAVIAVDIYGRGYRQRHMPVMEAVWPITALYLGPLAVWGYRRHGRPASPRWLAEHEAQHPADTPRWAGIAVDTSHCGAGCTLGDLIAEFAIFGLGATIAGSGLLAEYVGDYLLALAFGLAFQYLAIAPMRGLSVRKGIVAAAKADILSLTAFEFGLFGWMALMAYVLFPNPHLTPTSPVYWFLMQIGMALGFLTSWPANAWLIRRGIKDAM